MSAQCDTLRNAVSKGVYFIFINKYAGVIFHTQRFILNLNIQLASRNQPPLRFREQSPILAVKVDYHSTQTPDPRSALIVCPVQFGFTCPISPNFQVTPQSF